MSSIVKLKNGSFRACIRKKGHRTITKCFKTRANAKIWAGRIESDREYQFAMGTPVAGMTFETLAREYYQWWNARRRKDMSVPSKIRWWVERLGTMQVMDIQAVQIRERLNEYAKGRSPATFNRMRSQLSAIFRYAGKESGYGVANPVASVPRRQEDNKIERYLSDDERASLLAACRKSPWEKLHLLTHMALGTGARLGELLKLEWKDVDLETRTCLLRDTKNGADRVITLPPALAHQMRPWQEIGTRVFPGKFRWWWQKAVAEAGITGFRFHDLRHSSASYLVQAGVSLYATGQILGHKNIQTTARYAHLGVSDKQKITDDVLGSLTM